MKNLFYIFLIVVTIQNIAIAKTKVACIGNSITFGHGTAVREKLSYPEYLNYLVGDRYEVKNFGKNGATLLRHGDIPYYRTKEFNDVFRFSPDIIFIMLGTNDSKKHNSKYLNEFIDDYNFLIDTLIKGIPDLKEIVLMLPIPSFSEFGIRNSVIVKDIIPLIEDVAYERSLPILDLYHLFVDKEKFLPDKVHPNSIGQRFIAWRIAEFLLSDYVPTIDIPTNTKFYKFYSYRQYKMKDLNVILPPKILKKYYWVLDSSNNKNYLNVIKKILLSYGLIIINSNLNEGVKKFVSTNKLSRNFLILKSDGFYYNGKCIIEFSDSIDAENVSIYPYIYKVLRFFNTKVNFASIPVPGVEYRVTVGWEKGNNWFTIFDSFNRDLERMETLDILFLGNSITQGIGISSKEIAYRPGANYFREIFKNYNIYAAGISSDHVENLLYRIINGKYPKNDPKYVIITIGVNNFPHNSASEIIDGIKMCVKECLRKFPTSTIILLGPFIAGYLPEDDWRKKYRTIQSNLKKYSYAERVYFFDLEKQFILDDGRLNLELFRSDKLHINSNGYRVWAEEIYKIIEKIK